MAQSRPSQTERQPWIFGLIALVGVLALVHAIGGALAVARVLFQRANEVEAPFSTEFGTPIVRDPSDAAVRAGLRRGDIVKAINGQPFTAVVQLRDATRATRPGQPFHVTYIRPVPATLEWQSAEQTGLAAHTVDIPAAAAPPLVLVNVTVSLFLFFVPLFCLLTGFYVLFAKPFSLQAWCVFVVLAFPDCAYYGVILMPAPFLAPALFWNHLIQALLPLAILLFGVTFPERSILDRRAPWLKWSLLLPLLALIPYDFFATFACWYNFRLFPFLTRNFLLQARIGNALSLLCTLYFIAALVLRYRGSTGDARRRLRIMGLGSILGLGAFFTFVATSVLFRTSLSAVLPKSVFLLLLAALLLFPLSLAYVVVVQRAMELRILVRQGTKYFFAKQSIVVIRIALACTLAFEMLRIFLHPERRRPTDLAIIFAILLFFALYRLRLGAKLEHWIDRRFFRDAYSSEQVLSELSDEARTFTEVQPLLERVTGRISATMHIDRIAVFLRTGDRYQLQFATGFAPSLDGAAGLALPASSTTVHALARDARPSVVYREDPASWLVHATDTEHAALEDLSAELLVPLPGRNRLLGIMTLGPKRSEEPYSRTDRQLLQSVASQTGLALENAELLETLTGEIAQRERISSEIAIARDVQQRLFPQSYPQIAGVDMAGHCRPAHAVGGDYYDLFATETGDGSSAPRLGLAIGDISGKGISASLLMASLRAGLRIAARMDAASRERDLTGLMSQVNRLVFDSSESNRYATFFFAELDPETRLLTYINAGHNPPVVLRHGEAVPLPATALVVGLLEDATFEQSTIQLQPGDVLLAYTDGISEAMNLADEEWGEQAMLDAAKTGTTQSGCAWSAESLVTCLFREADAFTAGAPQHDDMTIVVCAIR